jgi:hypothetical protein
MIEWDDALEEEFQERVAWYATHLLIRDKRARVIPFTLNNIQVALERYKFECEKAELPCYMLILKARQQGVSTWAQATFFRDARVHTNRRNIVVAHTDEASRNLFQMTKFFLDNFEGDLETDRSSAKSLKFQDTKCEYAVQTAGAGGSAGRSFTFNGAHFSEVDYWPDPEGFYGGMMQTVPDEPGTTVIIESTADGPMLMLNQLWDQATEGRSEYKPFFFPWFVHDRYSRPVNWGDILKYAPKDWLNRNRRWVEIQQKHEEDQRALGRIPDGRSTDPPAGERSGDPGRDGQTAPERGPEGRGAPESQRGAQRENPQRLRGEDPPEGADPRRHLPDLPGGRVDGGSDGGPEAGEGLRQLRSFGADPPDHGFYYPPRKPRRSGKDGGEAIVASGELVRRKFRPGTVFQDSLTEYEHSLVAEFDLTSEQINWLRWCLENRCKGDETRRRREYPSRPDEAFEASGSDILDPYVLATWTRYAKENPPEGRGSMVCREPRAGEYNVSFDAEDQNGKIEIYEWPDPHGKYVLALDPAQGVEGGDWTVAFVMDIESGNQVAEFRATIDPDLAVNQIEYLAIYYNKALVCVEVNAGFGFAYIRHLEDRGTVPMYERMAYDKKVRKYTRQPGWYTTMKTRPMVVAELKESVRKQRCQVRSLVTLGELRTLWENKREGSAIGRVEARPGYHDDGAFAYGIAIILRNQQLGMETKDKEEERKKNNFILRLDRKLARIKKAEEPKITSRMPIKMKHVRAVSVQPDGRRSYI